MRVLLADDEARVRSALKLLLEQQPDWVVIGEADGSAGLLAAVRAMQPDAILIDWELPGISANTLIPALRALVPELIIIALSGRPESRRAALQAGADCFICKVEPPDRALAILVRVGNGKAGSHDQNGSLPGTSKNAG